VIQAKLFFCSDSAALDVRYNTISAFHILEDLNAPTFPIAIPRLAVIAMFSRAEEDPSNVDLQLQILLGPQQLFATPVPLSFVQQLHARTILEISGFVVPSPGSLVFALRNGETLIGSWAIRVNQIGQPAVQLNLPQPVAPRQN